MSWAAVSEALGGILADDPQLAGLVTGVFSLQAPQEQPVPYIVLLPVSGTQDDDFTHNAIEYLVQLSVFTERSGGVATCDAIARRVRTLLHRRTVQMPGFADAPVVFTSDQTFIDKDTIHALMQASVGVIQEV